MYHPPAYAEAEKFLDLIAGKPGERFIFRVIAERSDLKAELAEKAKLENRKLDDLLADDEPGTLSQLWGWLVERNAQGWAVYVVVNETTGNGDKDVVRVRAHFADFDEIFMNEDQCNERRKRLRRFNELVPTSMAVSSSPNKLHTYWLTRGAPLENFNPFQKRIAEFFGNDPGITNPSKVMRVPGFLHQKNEPHVTRIAWTGNPGPIEASCLKTALGQCLKELGPWPYAATKTKTKPDVRVGAIVSRLPLKDPLRDAEAERVRNALLTLLAIPAGDRDIRLKVGAALHSTGWGKLAWQIWDEWSRTRPEKFDEAEQEKAWRSFSIAANCEARRARLKESRLSPYRRHEVRRDDMIKYLFYK